MSKASITFAGVLATCLVAGGPGAQAQQAGGDGGRGGGGGGGGGPTIVAATHWAVVPDNTRRPTVATNRPRPQDMRARWDGGGCVGPTEGIHGPRLIGPCGPN